MKTIITTFVLFLGLGIADAQHKEYKTYYDNGKLKSEGYKNQNGEKEGEVKNTMIQVS